MKKNLFLAGFLATAFLFGCSDDVPENGGLENVKGEVGYVKVAINLPTTSGVPVKGANGNDNFDDGIEAEYKVNDIILAIFEGDKEDDATFKEAHNLSSLLAMQSSGNVTVKYKSDVLEISKPGEGKNVYALAIVNGKGFFSVNENKELKFGNTNFTGKLSKLNTVAKDVELTKMANVNEKNFLMLNAPITNKPSSATVTTDREVTTLVPLHVYKTKREAEGNWENADKIYVERAVAKVTTFVTGGTDNTLTIAAPGMAYDKATVKFEGWRLNLTNKTYYPVRKVSDWNDWKGYYVDAEVNRFFGEAANPYRVYWAVDPNYESTGDDALNRFTAANAPTVWNDMKADEYCAENTTTAAQMNRARLTGVLLKAKFTLKGGTEDDNLFMLGSSSSIYSEKQLLDFLKTTLGYDLQVKTGATAQTITSVDKVKEVFELNGGGTALNDTQAKDILDTCSNTIRFYKGGVMFYYTSVIKHFGDNPTAFTGDVNNPLYTEKDHLGRYGVVRNNWYEINITKVSGPGEPEIPVIPDEPVDKKHSFINAEINILSWAKRTQDVEL